MIQKLKMTLILCSLFSIDMVISISFVLAKGLFCIISWSFINLFSFLLMWAMIQLMSCRMQQSLGIKNHPTISLSLAQMLYMCTSEDFQNWWADLVSSLLEYSPTLFFYRIFIQYIKASMNIHFKNNGGVLLIRENLSRKRHIKTWMC